MDTTLKKDIYEHMAPVWTGSFSRDLTAESIVPDTMPDISNVVDAEGIITLRSKETQTGAVALAVSLSVSVLYMPENGGAMESLTVVIPAELRADAPGADLDCQTVAKARIRAIDARMVNSRKLSVRADVDCEAAVYQRRSLEIASGLADEGSAVHILTRSAPMTVVSDVREKTFVITDEYQLPSGCEQVERILSQRVDAAVEDVKYVSGKLVFRGRVRAGLIYGGPEGQITAGRYETEFSQIMEVDTQAADVTGAVTVMFTGAYFDLPDRQEDGKIRAEIHLVAQTVCRETKEIVYIADLYSNRTVLEGQEEAVPVVSSAQSVFMRQTVTGAAEMLASGGEPLAVSASVGSLTVEGDTVKTVVNVRAILRQEEGGYCTARCRLAAEFTTDAAGAVLQNISVTVADVYCAVTGGGLDVRAVLQMEACAVRSRTISAVCGIVEDQQAWEQLPAAPSLSMVRLEPGEDLWAVAKRYRSTVEAIAAANGDRTCGLLLIPKAR